MGRGLRSRLTLVSAPVGFGKSTLLGEWLAAAGADGVVTAWLSLDEGDNRSGAFWTNLIAALQTAVPGVGAAALGMLEAPEPRVETALARLLNELNAVPDELVLVLDDYHMIDAPEIQDAMAFVVEHLPANVHLVIATRADPALPLARLRAQGDLVELRAADLRFTPDEAHAYFNDVMDLGLTGHDVASLEGRTEGWVAALQLAGLSLQGRQDVAGFIAGFAGDDRYIVDYLVEEVLHRQPDAVRSFLLETSILARMTGPLCDAVTGTEGGSATLERLERGNLFVVPLDDRRLWYRYHHLFADVLQARLLDERPDAVPLLHRRASDWYERHGQRFEAIGHALAGADFTRAADLVELAIPQTRQHRQESTRRQWLDALPDELIRQRPLLSNAFAGSLLVRGEVEGVEARLRDAERALEATTDGGTVLDEPAFRDLPASIAIHRAGLARILGDVPGTVAHARRARELTRDGDHVGQGAAAALVGLAQWTGGDLDAAYRGYTDAMASFEKAGYVPDVLGCVTVLADIRVTQGRLHDALRAYERGLHIATGRGGAPVRGAANMHVGISEILRERNDLDGARRHLSLAAELGEENGLPKYPWRSRVALAAIRLAEGDTAGALDLLTAAERVFFADFAPDVRPIPALRANAWIADGRLAEAFGWAREEGLAVTDDLSYVREFEHTTLARLFVAQGLRDGTDDSIHEATVLLDRLVDAAEDGGRTGSVIEILIVKALAHHAAGDDPRSVASLQRAILLAEPEGYVRAFVDAGPRLAAVLKLVAKPPNASSHVRRLLAAFASADARTPLTQPLVEPLSERELQVLRLLDSDLDGPALARELTVSLNTVRTHTKNVYAKLGVNSRRAAVSRAAELGLLSGDPGRRRDA